METLNIAHHEKLTILKALNQFKHKPRNMVWEALKVSERTLYRKVALYNICMVEDVWQIGIVPNKKGDNKAT